MSEHAMQAHRLREIDDLLAECQRHGVPGIMVSYAQLRALRAEIERLTAERDRLRKWCDEVIDSPTMHHRRGAGKVTQLIARPQPLKENE